MQHDDDSLDAFGFLGLLLFRNELREDSPAVIAAIKKGACSRVRVFACVQFCAFLFLCTGHLHPVSCTDHRVSWKQKAYFKHHFSHGTQFSVQDHIIPVSKVLICMHAILARPGVYICTVRTQLR